MEVAVVLNQSKPWFWCTWPKWANQEDGCTCKLTCLWTVTQGVFWYINKRRCEHRKERTVKTLRVKSWFQGYPPKFLIYFMSKENVEFLFSELLSFLILKEAKFLKLLSLDLRVSAKVSYLFDVNEKWKLSLSWIVVLFSFERSKTFEALVPLHIY